MFGPQGERGPTGDHGQDGAQGDRGPTGDHGQDGAQGDRGKPGISSPRKMLVIFLFVTFCFTLLGVQVSRNTSQIENNQKTSQIKSCEGGKQVLMQFNKFVTAMAKVELRGTNPKSPTYDKSATPTRLERANNYIEAVVPLPDCATLNK